ncbi:MAG: hypothetical protein M1812_005194 [Candelaria pacifica]|nr:MAG: hypothetical protein M1812_005194 [Candelaria pacifica]
MHISFTGLAALAAAIVPAFVVGAPTDSVSDADIGQSGYLPNHNMDPAVVDSSAFGELWSHAYTAQEQFYAKPLVYTPPSTGVQIVFIASSKNYIRTMNAKDGTPLQERQIHPPFLQSDIGCNDIPNYIGIIGTPVIDPDTEIAYFFSKTYIPNFRAPGATGVFNGVYYFHSVNVNTLQDVQPPLLIDGSNADNDPRKYFIGGVILQRTALTKIGKFVYGGFGGHCDKYNYTGTVIGVDVTTNKIVTNFATEAGPNAPQGNDWAVNGEGGEGGIWQSGMAMATDGNRLFFVTGNGEGHENSGTPNSGSAPIRTLGQAIVNIAQDPGTGKVSLTDYFQPFEYQGLDGGDLDLGSGGICLLDPTVFNGAGVSRIGLTSGKNGKIYIVNADNLGGYRLGPGQQDGIIQTIQTDHAVFGGAGSYPLEGGYFYFTPVGFPTYAYKLGHDGNGKPVFANVGHSPENSVARVGVGIPTVTSYQGKEGTGILWMTDPEAGIRAWHAVPGPDGLLKTINLPAVTGANKFQRPAFGDTRLYITDSNGVLTCLGSPVNLPLTCTSPVNFGSVALGNKATQTVSCTANIAITSLNGASVGDLHFEVSNSSLPKGPIAKGTQFTFPVTWNLQNTEIQNTPNASYPVVTPGVSSTALTLYTTNGVGLYSTKYPISLTGTTVSSKAFLSVAPVQVNFGGLVVGGTGPVPNVASQFVISNQGLAPLTILGYGWTSDELDDNPKFTNTTVGDDAELGEGFTSDNLPAVGSSIQATTAISVSATFTPVTGTGQYSSFFFIWTTGGNAFIDLEGSASTAPIAELTISTSEGGWLPPANPPTMDFGKVAPGVTVTRLVRICNKGGSLLTITKSKPPAGVIRATAGTIDLHESQTINVNECATGAVAFNPPSEPANSPDQVFTNSWTLNTDDQNFGVHEVQITGTEVATSLGPTLPSGGPRYIYLGCFKDGVAGRLLNGAAPYNGPLNENAKCQNLCLAQGFTFAGTEYQSECYCGNKPPSAQFYYPESESKCNFACSGDKTQACGGDPGFINIYYDSTKFNGSLDSVPTGGPQTVPSVGNYTSMGCYSEATAGRALGDLAPPAPANGVTIESCAAGCAGYSYFGTEFGGECYCGNNLGAGAAPVAGDPDTSGCNMLCQGNTLEYCGGPNRLNLYHTNSTTPTTPVTPPGGPVVATVPGWNIVGCYSEGTNGRALTGKAPAAPATGLTAESCAAGCAGFTYFGVEYGGECYCGNTLSAGSAPVAGVPAVSGCNVVCNGNKTEYCGGGNRLNLYQTNGAVPATTSGGVSPPTPTGPIVVPAAAGFLSIGCYTEATNGRALSVQQPGGNTNTIEKCAAACLAYTYFGTEYGAECYCGNALSAGSVPATDNGCTMTCAGNSSEYCGGGNRLNMYRKNSTAPTTTGPGASATPTPKGPAIVQNIGAYTFQGCFSEGINGRALGDKFLGSATMNLDLCATTCAGYTYFGVEYGQECYCGNTLGAGSASVANQADCNFLCPGNATEYCGAGNRLEMYKKVAVTPNVLFALDSNSTNTTTSSSSLPSSTVAFNTSTSLSVPSATVASNTSTVASSTGVILSTGSTTLSASSLANSSSIVLITTRASSGISVITSTVSTNSSSSIGATSATSTIASVSIPPSSSNSTTSASTTIAQTSTPSTIASVSIPPSSSNSTTSTSISITQTSTPSTSASVSIPPSSSNSTTSTSTSITQTSTPSKTASVSIPPSSSNSTTSTSTSTSASPTPTGPIVVQGNVNFTYSACYVEPKTGRALSKLVVANDSMTVEACLSTCYNYAYAGLEYGRECWCGSTLNTAAVKATSESECNKVCAGNKTEICGAGSRLSLYTLKPPVKDAASKMAVTQPAALITNATTFATVTSTAASSNVTVVDGQTTSGSSVPSSSITSSSITSSSVVSSSSTNSSTSASPSSTGTTTAAPSKTSGTSSTTTSSNSTTIAPSTSASASSSSTIISTSTNTNTSTSTTSTSTTTSTVPTFTPKVGQTYNNYIYLGCANQTNPVPLAGASYTNTSGLTTSDCQSFCLHNNYGLAATHNGTDCSCGNGLQSYSAVGATGCDRPCAGNSSDFCGGKDTLSVWNSTKTDIPPTTVKAVGAYVAKGCYNGPALTGGSKYENSTGMTVESCVAFCQDASYDYAGVQYSTQCFCDKSVAKNATATNDGDCNNLCSGNRREFCGAYGKLNIYQKDSSSLDGSGAPGSMNKPNDVNLIQANGTVVS